MTQSERAKVGQALDDLRDALVEFVDVAMSEALGERWNETVADRETERLKQQGKLGRPVRPGAKTDLAELLKVIIFQKVAPWWSSSDADHSHRRISGYAGEILNLRNFHAHGDACVDEYRRLVDTSRRLLELLSLPVPVAFRSAHDVPSKQPEITTGFPNPLQDDDLERELARLGDSGKALDALVTKATQTNLVYLKFSKDFFLRHAAGDGGEISETDKEELMEIGATAFWVVGESYDLELNLREPSAIHSVLCIWARCLMVHLHPAVLAHLIGSTPEFPEMPSSEGLDKKEGHRLRQAWVSETDLILSNMRSKTELWKRWDAEMGTNGSDGWRLLSLAAAHLDDSSQLAHQITMMAKFEQASQPRIDTVVALDLLDESIHSARFLAAREPGSVYETALVHLLRRQGSLMNDLDRPEDAVRAFARADEIIDRYPSADPHLTE